MGTGVSFGLRSLGLTAAALLSVAATAEPFKWQIVGTLQNSEGANDAEIETGGLQATYYFDGADDASGPLALAPFLSRSSYASASAQRTEQSQTLTFTLPAFLGGGTSTSVSRSDSENYTFDGRKIWRDSGWFVGGGVNWVDPYEPGSINSTVDIDAYGFGIGGGRYLGKATSLELGLTTSRSTSERLREPCVYPIVCFPAITAPTLTRSETDTDSAVLSVLHVGGLDGLAYSVLGRLVSRTTKRATSITVFDAVVTEPPDSFGLVPPEFFYGLSFVPVPFTTHAQSYQVVGTIYPTPKIGVRMGFSMFDEAATQDQWEIGASWYFKARTAVEFGYARTKFDYGTPSSSRDAAQIRLTGRF